MKNLLFASLLFCVAMNAQNPDKLTFSYDAAGNQLNRILCVNCQSKPSKEIKEIEAVTKEDLLQFSPEDVISYYPNPVKEELYLTWQLTEDNYVNAIQVYSVSGQLLKQYQLSSQANNQNIPFQAFPAGVYAVLLNYSNGEQKSIKIIKQ